MTVDIGITKENSMPDLDVLSSAAAQNGDVKLIWVAQYADGTTFNQFQDGQERSTQDIDKANLLSLSLLDGQGKTVLTHRFKPGQYPFYRRRTAMRAGNNILDVMHIIGWRAYGEADKEILQAVFLYESDMHVEVGEFRQPGERHRVDEWQYPIEYLPCDNIEVNPLR